VKTPIDLTEIPDQDLPPEILAAKDKDEKILWVGRPDSALAFALSSGCLQAASMGAIILVVCGFSGSPYGVVFGLLMFTPILVYTSMAENARYAISDRRVIVNTGFMNRNMSTLDYDQVGAVTVNASAFERMFGVGSVTFAGGGSGPYRGFVSIKKCDEVASMVKSIAVDVKTDWMYPNAKREKANKGYRTTYCFAGEEKNPPRQQ